MPAYCTGVGKALLAFDHDAAEAAIAVGLLGRTEYTLTDPDTFRADLRRIRQDGVAYDRQEATPGLTCVAVPVMGPGGRPVAALSVAGAGHRFAPARFAPTLRRVAYEAARTIVAAKAQQGAPSAGGPHPRPPADHVQVLPAGCGCDGPAAPGCPFCPWPVRTR